MLLLSFLVEWRTVKSRFLHKINELSHFSDYPFLLFIYRSLQFSFFVDKVNTWKLHIRVFVKTVGTIIRHSPVFEQYHSCDV